jgi:hypothetical protein
MLLGLGDAMRPLRMISLAQRYHPTDKIDFAGIDRFDSRSADTAPLPLKEAHRLLRPSLARINLIPGDPHEALPRAANTLHGIELVLISASENAQLSAQQNAELLSRAWFFLHRVLAPQAVVLREEISAAQPALKLLSRAELERLAAAAPHGRAA